VMTIANKAREILRTWRRRCIVGPIIFVDPAVLYTAYCLRF